MIYLTIFLRVVSVALLQNGSKANEVILKDTGKMDQCKTKPKLTKHKMCAYFLGVKYKLMVEPYQKSLTHWG